MHMRNRILALVLALALTVSCMPLEALRTQAAELEKAEQEVPVQAFEENVTEATETPTEEATDVKQAPLEEETEAEELPTEDTATEATVLEETVPEETVPEKTTSEEETEASDDGAPAPAEKAESPAEAITEGTAEYTTPALLDAEEGGIASGTCGDNLTWTLDDSYTMTISGTGEMWSFTGADYCQWVDYRSDIKTVVVSEGVTNIGGSAFSNFSSLENVTLPESLTSIDGYAFLECSSLTSITIPAGVTKIGGYVFSECSSLETVAIPDGVTSLEGTFAYCDSLASVSLPDSLTSIGSSTFCGCSSLTGITIPDAVTSIGYSAFLGCSSLTEVKIPDSVTSIGEWTFNYCINLTGVTLPAGITGIQDYTFYRCKKLTDVTIPDGVTSIGDSAFSQCYALTSITIPEGVKTIGEEAFYWCYSLTEVKLPESLTMIGEEAFYNCALISVTIPAAVTSIGSKAFSSCGSLQGIWVDTQNPYYSNDSSGVLFNKDKTVLLQAPCSLSGDYIIPDTVTEIGKNAFDNVYSSSAAATSIQIPAAVTSIGEDAFDSYSIGKIVFFGNVPEIDSDSEQSTIFYDSSSCRVKVLYPAGNETWTESARQALSANTKANITWLPFDTALDASGSCGADLTWSVDKATKTLTISGTGAMDSWDWTNSFAPWIYFCDKIETVVIGEGVTSVSNDAFRYTSVSVIRFKGDAPAIGSNVLESSSLTAYYPAGNDTWVEVIQRYPSVTWIQEGSAFAGLHDIVAAHESMSSSEIRAAVQALDREELLESLRSGEAVNDLYTLDVAVQADYPDVVVTEEVPELYGMGLSPLYWGLAGASLNDLISEEESVTLTFDKPGTEITVPEGYESAEAIHFSLSLSNIQNPESLKVPVSINMLLPDSMNPFFAGIFWRNSETGHVEEIPSSCYWTKAGGMRISFVITGTGDYVIVPKSNASVGGTCGGNLTWTYDDTATLTISGSGEMYDYGKTSNLAPWAYYRENVNHIVIGESVTSIGDYAFYDCRFADKITIPANVQRIGNGAFSGLFTSIVVFEGNVPEIADDSFYGMQACAYYPGDNATWNSVIDQEKWGGAYAFTWTALTTSGVCGENLTWTFDDQTGVLTVSGTGEMTNYDFSGSDTVPWSVYNERITKVVLQDGVTSIGVAAFGDCVNMRELVIPDSVTSIYEFSICTSSMDELTIPASVTTLDVMSGIGGLDRIHVAEDNPVYSSVDGVLFNKDKTTLLLCPQSRAGEYEVPEGVTTIGEWAFQECRNLTKLVLPNTLTAISRNAFNGCAGLTELTIPDSVTAIDSGAMSGCYGLKTVTIGANVTDIGGGVFSSSDRLSAIRFRGNAPTFADSAFSWITATVYYPAGNSTWTADVMQDYGGTVTWKAYSDSVLEVPAKPYKIANVVSGVHVYWAGMEGVQKYGLWRSETGKDGTYKWIANPTVPHFTDVNVESGKTYYYKVTAMDANGKHSEKSEAIGIVYVSTPDIISRSNVAAGVKLGWDEIPGATGYAIYRKSYDGTDAWVRIATIPGNSTFAWIDTSVKNNNGEVYRYTVRALAGSDMKTLSGCRAVGRTMVRLSSQVLTSAAMASSTSIKCTWTTSSRVTGYEVRVMVGSTVYKTFTIGNYKTGVKTFTGLKSGQTYTIQVRTYKKVDGVGSFYSDWSTAKTVTLK